MENERKITAMGMAAGQARLLSITARMSDNELRAQIINNDKMRLATESSQVSDHYVQALNEAELMFANYDENNNASFKQLTFNALTAYNPYNNQYALTNASGNILLSETDAKNYEYCKNLPNGKEEFLKCYGLEQTTTFFDNLATLDGKDDGIVVFTNPNVADDPDTPINETTSQPTGLTREQLKLAFLGNEEYKRLNDLDEDQKIALFGADDVIPLGYDNVLNSSKYNEYLRYLDKYNQKYDEFMSSISSIMMKTYEQDILKSYGYATTDDILKAINNTNDKSNMQKIMETMQKIIDYNNYDGDSSKNGVSRSPYVLDTDVKSNIQKFYKGLNDLLNGNKGNNITNSTDIDLSGATSPYKFSNYEIIFDTTGVTSINVLDENGTVTKTLPGTGGDYSKSYVDSDGNTKTQKVNLTMSYDATNKKCTITEELVGANTVENMKNVAVSVLKNIKSSLANCWNPLATVFTSQEPAATYYKQYQEAAQALADEIYGPGKITPSETSIPKITELNNITLLYNSIGSNKFEDENGDIHTGYPAFIHIPRTYDDEGNITDPGNDFYQIYLNIVLDNVQDTYGEPHFTWIDTSAPTGSYNENGEAKAQWYENIWNMCQKNGYKVLKDGLASSTEWIQYAFESGIVNMQQVDDEGDWNPLIYTNCSDITSQTSDKMIAKAEAEYSAAMKKIENKDKHYDLELKNIDTEHNSLQTEYESIKSALDKHIDRVFKLYS